MKLLPLLIWCSFPSVVTHAQGQDTLAARFAAVIDEHELRRHLEVLASDGFEGRDTGQPGQKKAAQYIRDHFMECGIPPIGGTDDGDVVDGYFQPFELIERTIGNIRIRSGEQELVFLKELFYFSEVMTGDRTVDRLVYLGDGTIPDRIGKLKGDVVLLRDDGTMPLMTYMGQLRTRTMSARKAGANIVLVATPRITEFMDRMGHYVTGSRMRLATDHVPEEQGVQVLLVDGTAMDKLLGGRGIDWLVSRKIGRVIPVDIDIQQGTNERSVRSENVLAYIEGTDLKEELVVITAHYDHVGKEGMEVYNGADDDGSGTVGIMMIAKAFAEAKAAGHGPRRSILVMPVSGEEKGLLGSRYYTENPIYPLENTVANLNIDMIGRVDSAHAEHGPYVYVIGSDRLSSDLHAINDSANRESVGLELDYTFNDPDDPNRFYYRSDHYNFVTKGVPAIFYFSGVHEDYHRPTDTVDKIRFDLLRARTLLVFHTAWRLAHRPHRIVVDGEVGP